jgi:hypothetical protein
MIAVLYASCGSKIKPDDNPAEILSMLYLAAFVPLEAIEKKIIDF